MVGLEILLNGKPLYTIGIGDWGILTASVMYERIEAVSGRILEGVSVYGQGLASAMPEKDRSRIWPRHAAKVGDEVVIRIIETDMCDYGNRLRQPPKVGYDEPGHEPPAMPG